MNLRPIVRPAHVSGVVTAAHMTLAAAFAADIVADSVKLVPGVARAAGYEAPTTADIVANATNSYSDHSFFNTQVAGRLWRGERVEVQAKGKGWEWALVGKDGTGIGHLSISMVSPADKYVP